MCSSLFLIHQNQRFRDYFYKGTPYVHKPIGLPEVDCMPMRQLLDENVKPKQESDNVSHRVYDPKTGRYYFDFFSLDVEGAEWSVLQSIDFTTSAFGVIFMESAGDLNHARIVPYLQKQGYIYMGKYLRSDWFIHQHFDEIYRNVM